MEAPQKLLESVTHKTLHANNFSRSSTQASLVLTDLLSRYLSLLTSTCAKYAQHAGRTDLTPQDAFCALDELGVSMDELREYGTSEAGELARYARHSARRVEELNEFKAYIADGLRQDHDDVIPLYYAPVPAYESEDDEEEESDESSEVEEDLVHKTPGGVPTAPSLDDLPDRPVPIPPPSSPPLPLSPISNPSSPSSSSRKRARTANWRPPSHIPDFLPPFPTTGDSSATRDVSPEPTSSRTMQAPTTSTTIKPNPTSPLPLPQALTPSSLTPSDYLTQIPYSQSSLSTIGEWHLPDPPPQRIPTPPPSSLPQRPGTSRYHTPQTQPALIAAYHHILTTTRPQPETLPPANPSRHKVAMALLVQTQTVPRWDAPDTLYSSVAPCLPRVGPIGPTFPIPIGGGKVPGTPMDYVKKEEADMKLPQPLPRPASTMERLTPLISQQTSRIPDLARHVLPPAIHTRATRLTHPPVLTRGTQKVTYGPGIPAPWNANASPPPSSLLPGATPTTATASKDEGKGKDKDVPTKPALQDARLYATWEYEAKSFKVPLPLGRGRGRMGSVQGLGIGGSAGGSGSGVTISLGAALAGRQRVKTSGSAR